MTLLSRVVSVLESTGVPWAVIGAAALAAYGVSRSTLDLDLLVTDARVLNPQTWKSLDPTVAVDIRTGDVEDPLAGVVRLNTPGERTIDLVVGRAPWQEAILKRAATVQLAVGALRVVQPGDLILLKLYAGGSQDRWDIEQILAGDPGQIMIEEVEPRLASLPSECRELWLRILESRR